tara:strand:+ start:16444 stop:16710 length:267 start_codon:yes stop_codon:yes gene_type:complete
MNKTMNTTNGTIDGVDIIPDFENEIVDVEPPKKKPCGCNKASSNEPVYYEESKSFDWKTIGLIGAGLIIMYFLFVKKGKVEVPKVDVE